MTEQSQARRRRETRDVTHRRLSAVRSRDTKIELLFRKELFRRGLRYRVCYDKAIGKPDIAFPGKKVAVFVDSEFWHGYNLAHTARRLNVNRDYWLAKLRRNIERDEEVNAKLRAQGWKVIRFWEKDIRSNIDHCAAMVESALFEAQH